ncbi:uncharacterized protein PAC_05771 [Phialocephala subalpina]|uniref:SMP-30/Gluconolactonase/LRE-like region domain-containing protein n=1 Tax=Phialocephala subalpina TaxID=576137 RepID=A0A1L7WT03_9HELO|nr:uncharacterized protein PAC_05771 [Phialocephala subalpina]
MRTQALLFWLLAIFTQAATYTPVASHPKPCTPSTHLLHQFPLGTWIENIAVRSNGQLLVTLLFTPQLYLIDPFTSTPPVLLHNFTSSLGLIGIAETKPDNFIVTSMNYSSTTGQVAPNSSIAWRIDLHHASLSPTSNYTTLSLPPAITKVTDLLEMTFPNGLCSLSPEDDTVLIGDIRQGKIYNLDTDTGNYFVSIFNNLTEAVSQPIFGTAGVDGIHVRDNVIYYTNAGLGTFAKMPIHPNGASAGNSTIISKALNGDYYDDFALDRKAEFGYLVTGSGNSVERVKLDGTGKQKIVVGNLNSTLLAEPTAVAFGRTEWDWDVLYVVTAGGLATPVIEGGEKVVGGQVVAVNLRECLS